MSIEINKKRGSALVLLGAVMSSVSNFSGQSTASADVNDFFKMVSFKPLEKFVVGHPVFTVLTLVSIALILAYYLKSKPNVELKKEEIKEKEVEEKKEDDKEKVKNNNEKKKEDNKKEVKDNNIENGNKEEVKNNDKKDEENNVAKEKQNDIKEEVKDNNNKKEENNKDSNDNKEENNINEEKVEAEENNIEGGNKEKVKNDKEKMNIFLKSFYGVYDKFKDGQYEKWLSIEKYVPDDDGKELGVKLQYNGYGGTYPLKFTYKSNEEVPFKVYFEWANSALSLRKTEDKSFEKFDEAVKYFLECFGTMHSSVVNKDYHFVYEDDEVKEIEKKGDDNNSSNALSISNSDIMGMGY